MQKIFYKNSILLFLLIPLLSFAKGSDDNKSVKFSPDETSWMGVMVKPLSENMLKNLKLENGLEITKVIKDSPAEEAGLESGDILLTFDGKKLKDSKELVNLVRKSEVGSEVKVSYLRAGEQKSTKVKIGESENKNIYKYKFRDHPNFDFKSHKRAWLGVSTENLTSQLRDFFGVPENTGVLIKEIIKESPAEKYGLKAGDVIIKIGSKNIEDYNDLSRTINYHDPEEKVDVIVIRDKKEKTINVTLGEKKGMHDIFIYGNEPQQFDVKVPEFEWYSPGEDVEIIIDDEIIRKEDLEEKLKDLDEKVERVNKKVIKFNNRSI